jgi:hypothetical protein
MLPKRPDEAEDDYEFEGGEGNKIKAKKTKGQPNKNVHLVL